MIKRVRFRNYKVLADAELPLERFTHLIGPNGSGKSTIFQALQSLGASGSRILIQALKLKLRVGVRSNRVRA